MTDATSALSSLEIAAKLHAQKSWEVLVEEKNLQAAIGEWVPKTTERGEPMLSGEVTGRGVAHALRLFSRDFFMHLPYPGDQRPQFDVHTPGRTVLVWRYGGVWVEVWHPDNAVPTEPAPRPVAPAVRARAVVDPIPAQARRSFLGWPSDRLPFTRKQRTTNPKENSTR